MLNANKEKFQSFFMGPNQFVIPFFQRAYVWEVDNWSELWENILEELKELKEGRHSEHFVGTLIVKQKDSSKMGALEYELIDGQQRLTTICLLLRALQDASEDGSLRTWIQGLLVFNDAYGTPNLRIVHSKVDSKYFQQILMSIENNNELFQEYDKKGAGIPESKILSAYLFFRKAIAALPQEDIRPVVTILMDRLPVIHMALSKEDDVQQIFDTINSLGVRLTTGELLKNYMFADPILQPLYETLWMSVFETDEETIQFWDKNKTSGRIVRTTIELFLYSYLIILKDGTVKMERLFKEYKSYLKDKKQDELIEFAKELNEYAQLYSQLPDGEDLAEITFNDNEKRLFHVMNELDITTVFPLVLFIYKKVTDVTERTQILLTLESYLVRRTLCRLTTKNYNNLFSSLLSELKKSPKITHTDFHNKLIAFTEDTNKFPTDAEIKIAMNSSHLINKYSKEVLYCIALYDLNHVYQDNRKLGNAGFTVEHVMPKKWRNNWKLPIGADAGVRDNKLLTLGNLTLIMGRLNSSMRDASWAKKKVTLRTYSTLRQTIDYLEKPEWDEQVIAGRADDLYTKAISIWKR